jgi:hypothetical protein
LRNILLAGEITQQRAVILLSIGHSGADINVFKGNRLVLTRNIAEGGQGFDKAIIEHFSLSEKSLNITPQKAQLLKHTLGLVQKDSGEVFEGIPAEGVSKALRNHLDRIIREVQLTASHFRQLSHGGEIDELILTGAGAKLINIEKVLAEKLNISVRKLEPPAALGLKEEVDFSVFSVAVGAALEQGLNPNLMFDIAKILQRKPLEGLMAFRKIIIAFFGLVVFVFIVLKGMGFYYKSRLSFFKEKLDKQQSEVIALQRMKRDILKLQVRKELLEQIHASDFPLGETLANMSAVIDSRHIFIEKVTFLKKDNELMLQGKVTGDSQVSSTEVLSQLLSGLGALPTVAQVTPTVREEKGGGNISYFDIKCTLMPSRGP